MFTVQKGRVQVVSDFHGRDMEVVSEGADESKGAISKTGLKAAWPFVPRTQQDTKNIEPDTKEKQYHLRTLGPIMTHLGSERIGLVKEHTDKILELAYKFPVAIKEEKTIHGVIEKRTTDVLAILLESTLGREGGDYSVVGHEAVAGLRHFVDTELTLTKLKQM